MKKKILSLILAFTVMATSAPISNLAVYAENFTDEEIAVSDVDAEAENGSTDDETADLEETAESEEESNSETDSSEEVEDLEEDFSDSENDTELTIEPEENKEKSEEVETDIIDGGELDSGESQQAGSSEEYTYGDYRYIVVGDKATITGYTGDASLIFLPYEVNGYVVESIGNSAFYGHKHLRGISMQSSVKEIADYAFYECTNLSIVRIKGDGLEKIGNYAFTNCTTLEDITLPSSIKEVGSSIFDECTSLKTAGPTSGNYNIKLGFTETIPGYLFADSEIEEITVPDTIKNLGTGAFFLCTALKKAKLPSAITEIPDNTFYTCRKLESITIPNTVKEIGDYAFYECNNLLTVTGGSKLEKIGSYVFKYCTKLKDITLPSSIKEVGSSIFDECINLKTAGPTSGNYNIKLGFHENNPGLSVCRFEIEEITIPDTIKI